MTELAITIAILAVAWLALGRLLGGVKRMMRWAAKSGPAGIIMMVVLWIAFTLPMIIVAIAIGDRQRRITASQV